MKKNNIILFVFLGFVLIGVIYISQKSNKNDLGVLGTEESARVLESIDFENNNYINNQLGISFLLPKTFDVSEDSSGQDYFILINRKTGVVPKQIPDSVIFNSLKITKISNQTFESKVNEYREKINSEDIYKNGLIKQEKNKAVVKYTDPYSGEVVFITILETRKDLLVISYFKNSTDSLFYKDIVDSIKY